MASSGRARRFVSHPRSSTYIFNRAPQLSRRRIGAFQESNPVRLIRVLQLLFQVPHAILALGELREKKQTAEF